jgi:hypothetical protein
MQPENSLPCSQEPPSIGLRPKRFEYSSHRVYVGVTDIYIRVTQMDS